MSYSIEILNEKAIKLLMYLEELQLIRLHKKENSLQDEPVKMESFIGIISREKGDDLRRQLKETRSFGGRISKETAIDLHRQLDEMRNEWERF